MGLRVKLPLVTASYQHLLILRPLSWALTRENTERGQEGGPGASHTLREPRTLQSMKQSFRVNTQHYEAIAPTRIKH